MFPDTKKLNSYIRLLRIDRPIGTVLVLMPTLWSLWIASEGQPSWKLVAIFTLGCFLMRSAGCVINDVADRNFDPWVQRTKSRPIASGEVTVKEGIILFSLLSILSFLIILPLNPFTIKLSFAGLFLAIVYPFSKRIISIPQFVLGVSFGWGAIMAWASVNNKIELPAVLIFMANIFWSLAYDTIYALLDREDDIKIGVKSSAILFGEKSWLAVGIFLLLAMFFLGWAGYLTHLHVIFFLILSGTGLVFLWQVIQLKYLSNPALAMRYFRAHGFLGSLIFMGIVVDYLIG
jgi:4-hydroxybenzoate polyprenyltransferase